MGTMPVLGGKKGRTGWHSACKDICEEGAAIIMSTPQTGQIQQSQNASAPKAVYANAFRAELRGDNRMAGATKTGDARFQDSLRSAQAEQSANVQAAKAAGTDAEEENGFLTFIKTVIDIINPLQHLPVIGTIYRHMTGDELSPVARIAGGTLYGGPIGAAMGVVNAAVEESSGKDIGENMLAMLGGDDKPKSPAQEPGAAPTMLAAADIIWHTPAPDTIQSGTALASANTEIPVQRNLQMAALNVTKFPPSDTPTNLRTQTGGKIEPDRGSLPSATPVLQTREGMLAPTQTANRTHTGLTEGAGRSSAPDVGERSYAMHPAEATPLLQSQNAPVLAARMASTPEQFAISSTASAPETASANSSAGRDIGVVSAAADKRAVPQQMMAALDKYAALKKSQNAAMATGRLVPSYH